MWQEVWAEPHEFDSCVVFGMRWIDRRNLEADCKRHGGMCGDPRIVGGDGVMFYFHGRKNQDFCLVSDSDLHINAHFIGKRPEGRPRDFTWVQALGFVFASHKLTVSAKPVAKWDNNVDHLEFSYDGVAVEIDNMPMSSWTSADEQVKAFSQPERIRLSMLKQPQSNYCPRCVLTILLQITLSLCNTLPYPTKWSLTFLPLIDSTHT